MSDFFTRLVLHAGRGLGVVRPRPPALFEESDPVGPTKPPDEVERVEYAQSRRLADDAPRSDAHRAGEARPHVLHTAVDPRASSESHRPHPTVEAPPLGEASRRSRPERAVVHEQDSRAPAAAREEPTVARHPSPRIERPAVERPMNVARMPQADSSAGPPGRREGRAEAQPARAVLPSSLHLHARAVGIEDRVPEAKGPRQPSRHDQDKPEGAPDVTVEVTIGRVDVRAVLPPRPQPRDSRLRPPELSLDDYLRQRGRGGT